MIWYAHNNQPYYNEDGGSLGFNNILIEDTWEVYHDNTYFEK